MKKGLIACAVAIVLAVALAVAVGVYRHNSPDGALGEPGEASGGVALRQGSKMATVGSLMLCVTGKSPAIIISVSPVHPSGGFAIQAWGIRPNPWQTGTGNGIGAERKPLSSFPEFVRGKVTTKCGSSQPTSELGIQVARPGDETANSDALRVYYKMSGSERRASMIITYRITLCSPTDHKGHCSTTNPT